MGLLIRGTPLAFLPVVVGCYAYRPAATPAPEPATQVRVVFTTATTVVTGTSSEDTVRAAHAGVLEASGTVRASAADTIALLLGELHTAQGSVADVAGLVAMLPTAAIARIEERRFQVGTTILVGVAALAIAATAYILLLISAITSGF